MTFTTSYFKFFVLVCRIKERTHMTLCWWDILSELARLLSSPFFYIRNTPTYSVTPTHHQGACSGNIHNPMRSYISLNIVPLMYTIWKRYNVLNLNYSNSLEVRIKNRTWGSVLDVSFWKPVHTAIATAISLIETNELYRTLSKCFWLQQYYQSIKSKNKSQLQIAQCERALKQTSSWADTRKKFNRH